jgi:hypothetical protein
MPATSEPLTVEDRLELHELNSRYADLIDHRDWAGLSEIFIPDAVFNITTPHRVRHLEGLAAIQSYMEHEARHPLAHHITNVYVDCVDDGSRFLHTRLLLVQHDGTAESGGYDDRVVRTTQGWRVAARAYRAHVATG